MTTFGPNALDWMYGQADRAEAAGYQRSQDVDPMSGLGWKNGVSPINFGQDNRFYGMTGYYGNANDVYNQISNHAQAAGKPMGVLGSDSYTSGPGGKSALDEWVPDYMRSANPGLYQQLVSAGGGSSQTPQAPPTPTGGDPYHPPGYTPGVAATSPGTNPGGDPYHPAGYTPGVAAQPAPPSSQPGGQPDNTVPPPVTQPGMTGPSSSPPPPGQTQQPMSQPSTPARPRGFGSAPRWGGGGMGGQGRGQFGGWQQHQGPGGQQQAMRNLYGSG